MTRSPPSHAKIVTDPAQMPPAERGYYRVTWGFDPGSDCRPLGGDWHQYEACIPLGNEETAMAINKKR